MSGKKGYNTMTASKTSPQGEKKSFISSATPDGAYGAAPAGRGKVLLIAAVLVAVGVSAGIWQMGIFGGSSGEFVADRFTVTERSYAFLSVENLHRAIRDDNRNTSH